MKFKNLFLFAAIAIVASCGKYEFDATQVNKEVANQQAKNQLGVDIDPNQDWIPVRNGSVTIIANADLENIVRVEVLTETPFENEDAMVLNSMECKAGQQVTLNYEAPNYLTQLVAACVNDQGVYFIKVFDIDAQVVDFQATNSAARTRANVNIGDFPATIVLGKGIKSFNAERAEASQSSPIGIMIKDNKNKSRWYTAWKDNSWANDMLWQPKKVEGDGGWVLYKNNTGTICRDVTDEIDIATIETDINKYLQKYGNGINGKANNWYNTLLNNAYFQYSNNELESDGNPLLLVPIQMNTTEGNYNSVYYYYYNPDKAPQDKDELANYIKSLPKFKCLWGFSDATFKREREYLLPYYGDGIPVEDTWGSPVIPKGYKIGFLNRKAKGDMYSNSAGCVYGVGKLNVEVNHLIGHYFNVISSTIAQDVISNESGNTEKIYGLSVNGMDWDNPRIIIHPINNRNYLCFEDGSDLNFCDMVVEIKTGTKIQLSAVAPDVNPTAYTLCFEDRPAQADYDMNDVVLMATPKKNNTEVELRLVACGAKDKVYLKIEGSSKFNDKEIHELFGLQEDEYFVNTQIGGKTKRERDCPYQTIKLNGKTIMQFLSSIKIYNATTGQTIGMPKQGEAPYGIIVPMRFNYPKEGSDIRKSYPEFINWVRDVTASQDWYRSLEGVDRFPTLINK
jgi:hypothetical protein